MYSVSFSADPTIPCICGSCDLAVCSANSCYNGVEPFCGTNTGCNYIQGSTPPVEISLAFADDIDESNPPFECLQVMVHKQCIINVTLTGAGLFTINKNDCIKGGAILNRIRLLKYGDADCNFNGFDGLLTGPGASIDTSCATPVYVGKRYELTFGDGGSSSAELFITAFCNAAKGGTKKVCLGNYPPESECGNINVAKPSSSFAGQTQTTARDNVMKITSDFLSFSSNSAVKSKNCTSILGVIMMLGWHLHQWN
jgi:hypothetical protein